MCVRARRGSADRALNVPVPTVEVRVDDGSMKGWVSTKNK